MTQIASGRRTPAAKRAHPAIGRCHFALMAVSAGFFAISVSSFGADLGTGYSTVTAVPSGAAPAGRRTIPAHPIDPPDAKPDRSAHHARVVDQLYEELMHWTPPACSSTSSRASVAGAC
jgi:hypothetical protein